MCRCARDVALSARTASDERPSANSEAGDVSGLEGLTHVVDDLLSHVDRVERALLHLCHAHVLSGDAVSLWIVGAQVKLDVLSVWVNAHRVKESWHSMCSTCSTPNACEKL